MTSWLVHFHLWLSRRLNPAFAAEADEIIDKIIAPRFEVVNDGPGRWVLIDNWTDDPAPVFSTVVVAQGEKE